jgi:hypothetical protein
VTLAFRSPASVEAPAASPGVPRPRMLAHSRGPVARLAALFAVDSLAGGFVVQAYLGYWLSLRYGATTQTIGITFAVLGMLQTASLLAAPVPAARVGLLPPSPTPPATSPALAGFLLPFGLALPFVIAGAATTAYDLTLWRIFRSVRLPAPRPERPS